jgi:thiol-disulfide isomerase/thioredoxin
VTAGRAAAACLVAAALAVAGCTARPAAVPQRAGTCLAGPGPSATTPAGGAAGAATPGAGSSPAAATPGTPGPSGATATGPRLPELTLTCLDGSGPVRLPVGRPYVVNLWASWCAPCREELPEIERYAHTAGALPVVGVDTRDTTQAGRSVVDDDRLTFPVLADPDARLASALGRGALPATVLVDAGGRIAHVYAGRPLTAAALAALVQEHLGSRS